MAWRIHDSVQRGEIDNRERGKVTGKLWLDGLEKPVALDLKGNACPDLAGCRLEFENPNETVPLRRDATFHLIQQGAVGDLTASRKVRVLKEAYERKKKGLPVAEHLANCLYLEWFSEANGRVVVESTEFRLTLSAPAWTMTPEEDQLREQNASKGFTDFMSKLNQALDSARHEVPEDKEWDEFDYEKLMRESDARTDKYSELLDKYMDHPDRERIVAREMGWDWLEEAIEEEATISSEEPFPLLEEEAPESKGIEVPDDFPALEPDPATEGVDWIRDEEGAIVHPLSRRAREGGLLLWRKCNELKLGKGDDDDLTQLITEYQITGAKLAGALNSLAYGRDLREGAFIVAYLKRALSHLHESQAALEEVGQKNLLPAELVLQTKTELFGLREEILKLMDEFRKESM